jgi:hypothetical protein
MVLAGAPVGPRAEDTILEDNHLEPTPTKTQVVTATKPVPKKEVDFDDDDESLSYFAKLANED